jgi:hypothetical protein
LAGRLWIKLAGNAHRSRLLVIDLAAVGHLVGHGRNLIFQ